MLKISIISSSKSTLIFYGPELQSIQIDGVVKWSTFKHLEITPRLLLS